MSDDPRDARIGELEMALADVAGEARAGSYALCAHELQMRLENILRRIEAVRPRPVSDDAQHPISARHQEKGPR